MGVRILTSMFQHGFPDDVAIELKRLIQKKRSFVFVASEFEKNHDITDDYYTFFLNMFVEKEIDFENKYVVDSRMSKDQALMLIKNADVLWLSGGDTPTQYEYLKAYGLLKPIKNCEGIIIGMSAGAINMAETAICTVSCGHEKQEIYNGIGLVDISVEPHFNKDKITNEIIELSKEYTIYGVCDNAMIIEENGIKSFLGNIFVIDKGKIKKVS